MRESFKLVKEKYNSGKWTKKMLRVLLVSGRISEAEFSEIVNGGTGEERA